MHEKNEIMINFINNEISTVPITLNNMIMKNNKELIHRDEIKEITNYIDNFLNGKDVNRYLLLPGLRGVGKTTILYQIYNYLLTEKHINPNQILYLSCEKLNDMFEFKILDVIECFLKNHHQSTLRTIDKKIFILIDESQYDYNWALSGKIIYDSSKNIFMIFTGSSSLTLEYNADSARRLLKRNITPLNYSQYLKLKYGFESKNMSNALCELILNGNVENAIKNEKEINSEIFNIIGYTDLEWDNFLEYGGFPALFDENNKKNISEILYSIVKKVIQLDMRNINKISSKNQIISARLLSFLALQHPGEVSLNNIANYLECSPTTIKNLLNILEKTHLIFHCESYGSASKRLKKPWKYYFATSSLRHSICTNLGNISKDINAYKGILLENFVASSLFNLNNKHMSFNIFYDSNKKNNVDFIIQQGFNKPIPIEVGIVEKNKKQILSAINRYNSEYGIIISDTTNHIEKEDNIIYLPPKTFSLL